MDKKANKKVKKLHAKVEERYRKTCEALRKNPYAFSNRTGDETRRLLNYGYVPGSEQ